MNTNSKGDRNPKTSLATALKQMQRLMKSIYYGKGFFISRVSGGSDKIHKALKPFGVVDIRGPQVFQAGRRVEDVTIEDYMIGRQLLSATAAFGCI